MSAPKWMLAACTALAMVACQKAEEPAPAEPPVAEEEEEAIEPEAVEAEEDVAEPEATGPTADNMPIPEDFAEEAAEEVTAANYEETLAAMEKELAE